MKSFFTNTFFPLQEIAGIDRLSPLNLKDRRESTAISLEVISPLLTTNKRRVLACPAESVMLHSWLCFQRECD